MESKNHPKENTPMPANTKATDEVQLNIETVTPATLHPQYLHFKLCY